MRASRGAGRRRIAVWLTVLALLIVGPSACVSTPQPTSSGSHHYSYLELYRLYTLAHAAWRVQDQFRDTDWDLDYFVDEDTNTIGFTSENIEDGALHVVFRGTSSDAGAVDRQYNFRIHQRRPSWHPEFSPVKVHRGFLSRYERLRDTIHHRVLQAHADRIVFTGHSAGGVLAFLAFIDIGFTFPDIPIELVTFGAPRAFNPAGARWVRRLIEDRPGPTRAHRFVHGNDLVADLPPAIIGYRHVTEAIYFGPRPRWYILSAGDHYPGYRDTLRRLVAEEGVNFEDLSFSDGP